MLSYQTTGSSEHPPLIFLHGLGASSQQTTSAFPNLKNTHVIAPDMPGHGGSQDFDPAKINFSSFADHVICLMDHLGISSCNIGGLSMGSGITINLALRYPERVKNLILLRPSWLGEKMPNHLKLVAYVGQWIEQYGLAAAREHLQSHPDFIALRQANKPVADSIEGLFQRPITPASTAVLYKMWQDSPFSTLEDLAAITHPALILTTSRDELHPQTTADIIAAHIPHAQRAELPPRYHEPAAYGLALTTIVEKFLFTA